MLSIKRNEKVTCKNRGRQTTTPKLVRLKNRCSTGTIYCTKCPNVSTTSQADLKYHIPKKHPRVRSKNIHQCNICLDDFSGFCPLRKHRNSQHGIPIRTSNFDMNTPVGGRGDAELKQEINSCNHFLVDSELEKERQTVFNFAMPSINKSILNEKLDHVFNQLQCRAKVNLAFEFVLRNIEDATCRYFYAHENITVVEKSNKLVCTEDER